MNGTRAAKAFSTRCKLWSAQDAAWSCSPTGCDPIPEVAAAARIPGPACSCQFPLSYVLTRARLVIFMVVLSFSSIGSIGYNTMRLCHCFGAVFLGGAVQLLTGGQRGVTSTHAHSSRGPCTCSASGPAVSEAVSSIDDLRRSQEASFINRQATAGRSWRTSRASPPWTPVRRRGCRAPGTAPSSGPGVSTSSSSALARNGPRRSSRVTKANARVSGPEWAV